MKIPRMPADSSNSGDEFQQELPIDGTLDLHTFHPKDVKDLVPHYIELCREKGIYEVRIIHGKGTGTLRRIVQSILSKHPAVADFGTPDQSGGSWGSTIATLHRPEKS